MKLTIATSLYLSSLVSANGLWARQSEPGEFGAVGRWAPGSFGSSNPSQDEEIFEAAGRSPNMTSSATFKFAPGNFSQLDGPPSWTWRLNISQVADPENEGQQVINTQWDLQWPGGGSLQSLARRADLNGSDGGGLCLALAELNLPSNITSRYSESDQGNCSMVLGEECAEKLRMMTLRGDCGDPPAVLGRYIEECRDVLPALQGHSQSTGGVLINSTFNESIQSGDTFWYHTSGRVPTANISYPFVDAETRLNMLFIREIPGVGKGTTAMDMFCQVVNPSATNAASSSMETKLWMAAIVVIAGLVLV